LFTLAKAKPYTPQKYIDKFAPIAIQLSIETQIPSSVILGVAIVESGFGNSKNCRLLNNHFGVKGKNTLRYRHKTYRSKYKEYASDSASYADFCRIVSSKKYFPKIPIKKCISAIRYINNPFPIDGVDYPIPSLIMIYRKILYI
jgi:flagellum-specific peptidoglycan hydrolase FlgJ